MATKAKSKRKSPRKPTNEFEGGKTPAQIKADARRAAAAKLAALKSSTSRSDSGSSGNRYAPTSGYGSSDAGSSGSRSGGFMPPMRDRSWESPLVNNIPLPHISTSGRAFDNSPSYGSTSYGTTSRPPVTDRGIDFGSSSQGGQTQGRYVLDTSASGAGRWKEVPITYTPKQGELVVQGPKSQMNNNPLAEGSHFFKVPVGGIQRPAPVSNPQGGSYQPGIAGGSGRGATDAGTDYSRPTPAGGVAPTSQNDPRARAGTAGTQFINDNDRGSGAMQNWPGAASSTNPTGAGSGGSAADAVLAALDKLSTGTGLEIGYTPGDPIQVNLPAFPKAPDFKFKRNDFSDEANAAMAKAYGPRYAAIDAAKQSVVEQQARSDEIVKGIYSQLYADLNSGADSTKAQYDTAATNAMNSGQNTANLIRKGASNVSADAIAEMKAQGLSADEIAKNIGSTMQDTNFAANQAIDAGQANQQAMAAQGAGATDFARTMAGAAKNQGAVSREQIAADAAQNIQEYSNQAIDLSGQQSAQAISYANDLTNQDTNLQQLQYGVLSDRYQGDVGAYNAYAQGAFQNAGLMGQYQGQLQNEHQFEVQQMQARDADIRAQAAQIYQDYQNGQISMAEAVTKQKQLDADKAENDRKAAQWAAEMQLKTDEAAQKYDIDRGTLDETGRHNRATEANAGGAAGTAVKQEGLSQFATRVADITGDPATAKQYYDIMVNEMNQNGTFGAVAEPAFITEITTKYANAPGINPTILGQVASEFHRIMYPSPASAIQPNG